MPFIYSLSLVNAVLCQCKLRTLAAKTLLIAWLSNSNIIAPSRVYLLQVQSLTLHQMAEQHIACAAL